MRPLYRDAATFLDNAIPVPEAGCFLWMGYCGPDGYGVIKFKGKLQGSHRVSWQLAHGSIPDNLQVLHSCDTPACINPRHLFLGTNHDNIVDACRKGRHKLPPQPAIHQYPRGEKHGACKLSWNQVLEIRAYDDSVDDETIAQKMDVTTRHINGIRRFKRRIHDEAGNKIIKTESTAITANSATPERGCATAVRKSIGEGVG